MKRLVEETDCIHGYFRGCTFRTDEGGDCPRGTSREVAVDLERADAAFRIALEVKGINLTGISTNSVSSAIVEAALGGL